METVASRDGTNIAFDRYGAGPPIILVGDAFQYRGFDPRTIELAKLLSSRFTVFHYDRRGRGDSGDSPPYDAQREIEDLEALLEAAGGSASVFGMSSGAALALDAATPSDAITSLAVYEAPFIVDEGRTPFPTDYLAQLSKLIAANRRGDAVKLWLRLVGVPAPPKPTTQLAGWLHGRNRSSGGSSCP
jgi:pimeloyl-ACP methyl ester carboxylesterase